MLWPRQIGVGTTEHTYEDAWLAEAAEKVGVSSDFESRQMKDLFDMDVESLKVLLKRFKEFDIDGSGFLSREQFEKALGLNFNAEDSSVFSKRNTASSDNFFSFFDTEGTGYISYREFVQGLGLLTGTSSKESQVKLAFLILDVEGTSRVRVEHLKAALSNVVSDGSSAGSQGRTAFFQALEGVESLQFAEFCTVLDEHPTVLQDILVMARTRVGFTFESARAEAEVAKKEKEKEKEKREREKEKKNKVAAEP